jgi:putative membrane protein
VPPNIGIEFLLFPLLLIVILCAVAYFVMLHTRSGSGVDGKSDSDALDNLDVLKERYARGEINREEYERIRRDLEQ